MAWAPTLGEITDDEVELLEERAAIAKFDMGLPRPMAEAVAYRILAERRWWAENAGTPAAHIAEHYRCRILPPPRPPTAP